MNTVFFLWLTFCPLDVADGRCTTERHVCVWSECVKIIQEREPTSMLRRPIP
jgi:hypothetical protein